MPDLFVEGLIDCAGSETCAAGRDIKIPSGMDSTYGALMTWGYFFLVGSLIVSWIVHSIPILRRSTVERRVYKHYAKKLEQWNKERRIILMYFTYITKRWDIADRLIDKFNPFLKDIHLASNDTNENVLGARLVDAGDNESVTNIAHDPRVTQAFAVLQKYGYFTWRSFILDFKQSLQSNLNNADLQIKDINKDLLPRYDEFMPRMKWSLIEYVHKLDTEWEFKNDDVWWQEHFEKEILKCVKSTVRVSTVRVDDTDKEYVELDHHKGLKKQKSTISRKGTVKPNTEFDLPVNEPDRS